MRVLLAVISFAIVSSFAHHPSLLAAFPNGSPCPYSLNRANQARESQQLLNALVRPSAVRVDEAGARSFPSSSPPMSPFPIGGSNDPMEVMNRQLRSDYAHTRSDLLHSLKDPLIISFNNSLTLMIGGKVISQLPASTDLGTSLKLACHFSLGTFVALDPFVRGIDNSTDLISGFVDLAQSTGARQSLEQRGCFSPAQLVNAHFIFDQSMGILKRALAPSPASARLTVEALRSYARNVLPAILSLVDDFVADSLQFLERQVDSIRAQLSTEQWNQARFLVLATHMPRQGLEMAQLFSKEFQVPLEDGFTPGKRLIYCEALSTIEECLNLLSVHLEDNSVGFSYFNQTLRMHRDLLADATEQYLATHKLM